MLRDGSPSRILMLTASADVDDRVDGLELGADDYVGKPLAFQELIARIHAVEHRGRNSPDTTSIAAACVERACASNPTHVIVACKAGSFRPGAPGVHLQPDNPRTSGRVASGR